MSLNANLVLFYVLFWAVRIRGCVRRGRQPLLRGPEWFFDVHVRPDFYAGAGRRLLRAYWLRMLMPFAIDIPLAVAIFVSGRLLLLYVLILGLSALIHVNHLWSVRLAQRQAQPFSVADATQPLAQVALSLTPRRLRDYSHPAFEWALAIATTIALAATVWYFVVTPGRPAARMVFGIPVVYLYLQVGLIVLKSLIVSRRSAVPSTQIAEYVDASEQSRRYYLLMCDWYRGSIAAGMLFWPVSMTLSPAVAERVDSIWMLLWIGLSVVATVWVEIKRHRLAQLSVRVRPAELPDLRRDSDPVRWPICYAPSTPLLMLKGARGYSLNLADRFAQLTAAYAAGFAVLIALLRMAS